MSAYFSRHRFARHKKHKTEMSKDNMQNMGSVTALLKPFALACLLSFCSLETMAQVAGISCCDWMMLKRQKLGAVTLSKDINADGLEMDMGPLGKRILFENRFRPHADSLSVCRKDYADVANGIPTDRKKGIPEAEVFRRTADSLGISISSVAMSGFYAQNLLKRAYGDGREKAEEELVENYRSLMQDCLNTMRLFGAKVAFLPLGGSGDGWRRVGSADYKTLVKRLRTFGRMAEKEGVVIGVRTSMDADFNIRFLKDVKSKAVKIYFSVQDACDNNLDICSELRKLGKERIAQIHISNTDGVTLRNDPEVDMQKIKATLEEIGYHGWLTVERSRNVKDVKNVRANYGDNVAYLKEIFEY